MHDLLVDLANLARDERLGGVDTADWARVDRVLSHWRAHLNPHSNWLLVADDNLARDFGTAEARDRWTQLVRSGELISAPDADPVLLERARTTGASVLSHDGFVGHRRRHSWIQGDAEHFFRWRVDQGDQLAIVLEPMRVVGDYTMTRAAEKDERKARGFGTRDLVDGPLAQMYRCVNPTCRASADDLLQVMPVRVSGRVACPECRRPVVARGPRPPGRRLKLLLHEQELDVVQLADGQQLVLGRGPGPARWDVALLGADTSKISRDHVRLSIRGGQVVAEDLNSTNGTGLARWSPSRRAWEPAQKLLDPTTLLARDRLELPGSLVVQQSGLRYVVPDVQ
ncbi:MAG: hypothetical protein JWM96_1382 [Alphaproteobacteria bacterium]|nr:hypothetical protein [Alphaproteobacteria bacterium]